MNEIAAALGKRQSAQDRIDFYVGQIRCAGGSVEPHAKIIAVDGRALVVSRHTSVWPGNDYLEKEPVFRLSMRVESQTFGGAHLFAESLWGFVRKEQGSAATYSHRLTPDLARAWNTSPPVIDHKPVAHSGSVPALWATCPGWGVFYDESNRMVIKDAALLCFLRAVKSDPLPDVAARIWEANGWAASRISRNIRSTAIPTG